MIHVRQYIVNPYGQQIKKIKSYKGDLGSGVHDTNKKEIFVNDIIEGIRDTYYGPECIKGIVDFGANGFFVNELETENVYRLTELLPCTIIGRKDQM